MAEALARRGWVESSRGQLVEAEKWYVRCRDVAREHGSESGLMRALQHFARIHDRKKEYAKARACYEEVIRLARKLGRPHREIDRPIVQDGQCPGKPQAYRARPGVRPAVTVHRAPAEHLGRGGQLHVDLETDYRLVGDPGHVGCGRHAGSQDRV